MHLDRQCQTNHPKIISKTRLKWLIDTKKQVQKFSDLDSQIDLKNS
jgi:hypothetical protein